MGCLRSRDLLYILEPSGLRSTVNRRDAFICFINSEATTQPLSIEEEQWEGQGLLSSSGEGPVESTQWPEWLAIIARSRHSAAYCRLRVNSSVRSHSRWKHSAPSRTWRVRALFLLSTVSLLERLSVLARALHLAENRSDTRLFRCESIKYEPHAVTLFAVTDSAGHKEIRILSIRDFYVHLCSRC